MKTNREIAESYWAAEASRDLDAIVAHYNDDATFVAPGWTLKGVAEIRRYYAESAELYPGLEVRIVGETTVAENSAMEWSAVLIDGAGSRFPLDGVNIMRFENQRISSARAYFDPSGIFPTSPSMNTATTP